MNNTLIRAAVLTGLALASGAALACGGADSGKHMGNVTSINPEAKTFTIRDAETSKNITFKANDEIIKDLKKASGSIMVNFEANKEGALEAVGVTF